MRLGAGEGRSVLIVGESPAPCGWRLSGRPFYTPEGRILPSGRYLSEVLRAVGLSVDTCSFTELVKCYVAGDRARLDRCGQKCWSILARQLQHYGFRLVILLGVKTLGIANRNLGTRLQLGELSDISVGDRHYKVLPIFHPSPINHAPVTQYNLLSYFSDLNEIIFKNDKFKAE